VVGGEEEGEKWEGEGGRTSGLPLGDLLCLPLQRGFGLRTQGFYAWVELEHRLGTRRRRRRLRLRGRRTLVHGCARLGLRGRSGSGEPRLDAVAKD
jgi:hypothetical protein